MEFKIAWECIIQNLELVLIIFNDLRQFYRFQSVFLYIWFIFWLCIGRLPLRQKT